MNKQTAAKRGYEHTGHFAWGYERDTLKPHLEEYRKAGYKAIIASVPPDPLSRGHHGTSYIIMVEHRYFVDRRVKHCEEEIAGFSAKSQAIMARHVAEAEREIAELAKRRDDCAKWLSEHRINQMGIAHGEE